MRRIAPSMTLALLACPLAFVSLSTFADECENGACMGSNNPAMMDANNDGQPDTPIPIVPTEPVGLGGDATWEVVLPWECGNNTSQNKIEGFTNRDSVFYKFVRANNTFDQKVIVRETTATGAVKKVEFYQYPYWLNSEESNSTGTFELLDSNNDGGFDTMQLLQEKGGNLAITSNLAGIDTTGDGNADYVTMPWANAVAFYNPRSDCGANGGTSIPQISLPMTDTDKDGKRDSVVLDLNGDNQADPEFMRSPSLQTVPNQPPYSFPGAAKAVPTLAQYALLILSLALAGMGWASVRRNISR